MNRQGPDRPIRTVQEAAPYFQSPPAGLTPMLRSLRRIFRAHGGPRDGSQYLLVVVTDGEPNDGTTVDQSIPELFQLLSGKPGNIHVSMVECTDQKETMDYLENWNRQIDRFDNTEDYPEEIARIRQIQRNPNYKFTYVDYVVKVLLATFLRRYFAVDMVQLAGSAAPVLPNIPIPATTAAGAGGLAYAPPAAYYAPPPPHGCCTIF
jgi:hypothetical protein